MFIIKDEKKYFFIDFDNEYVDKEKYYYVDAQRDGYFRFCRSGKWGYLNGLLTEDIAPEYAACGNFQNDRAPVLIDCQGHI